MNVAAPRSDLERLPYEAALDMWASWPATPLGPELGAATLRRFGERAIDAPPSQQPDRLLRLVVAVAARGATGLTPESLQQLGTLLRDRVDALGASRVASLAAIAWDSAEPLGAVLVEAVRHAGRLDAAAAAATLAQLAPLVQRDAAQWREHSVAPVRDALVDGAITNALHGGAVEGALTLAERWPPGRSALALAVERLAQQHQHGRLAGLLRRLGPESAARRDAMAALWSHAAASQDGSLAACLAELAPDPGVVARVRACAPAPLWPQRRAALFEALVAAAEAPWLVEEVAAEPDPADALAALAQAAARRPRLAAAAAVRLAELDPERALARVMARLRQAAMAGTASASELRRLRDELERLAQLRGEPGIASAYLSLLRRELRLTTL